MDSTRPLKVFGKQASLLKKLTIEIVLSEFRLFSFFKNFSFDFHGFHLKKLKIIQYDF